jgi:hypothetical protein
MCKHVFHFLVAFDARCEMLAVGLAQGRYKRVAVLAADFAILVAMTLNRRAVSLMVYSQAINCDFPTRR